VEGGGKLSVKRKRARLNTLTFTKKSSKGEGDYQFGRSRGCKEWLFGSVEGTIREGYRISPFSLQD